MKITLVETIIARDLPVLDTSSDDVSVSGDIVISDGSVVVLDIPVSESQLNAGYIRQQVRLKLRERIVQRFKDVINRDIRVLVGEVEGSPPIIIYWERVPTEAQYIDFVRRHTDATFQIVKTNKNKLNSVLWGEERVWRVDAPSWMNYRQELYYKTSDTGMTCAYDYLITKFGNKKGYKKLAKNKTSIDNVVNGRYKKADIHQKIYDEWLCLNKDKRELKHLTHQHHPLPDIVEVGDLEDEMYKIQGLDLREYSYTDTEKNETLSILDLVRWCISGNVRLNVYDYDNADYLSYNPNDFLYNHPDIKKNRHSISVKIAHKHAYFIDDKNVKTGLSVSKTRHKLGLVDCSWKKNKEPEGGDKGELDNEYHINRKWCGMRVDGYDSDGCEESDGYQYHKNCPPPQLSQLREWMSDINNLHHYYVGLPNINGIVSRIYRSGIVPDKLTGSAHSVKVATFGHLKIYSYANQPQKRDLECYEELYKLYPKLKSDKGVIPTDTTIADGVYESCELPPILSMMNSQVKRMFYDSELKPDNRKISGNKDTGINRVFSFDVNKAYTTAMEFSDYNWNIYDAVSQPQKYRENFNPDWFYLGYNKTKKYPCISGSGLLLYHGSLLRYVLDKVDIKYFIKPVSTLAKNHFIPFIEKCRELNKEIEVFVPKILINRFIGNCKKKDGIQQYGLFINPDKLSVNRQFLKNYIPSRMTPNGLTWRNEPILTSRPQKNENFENAQPIRLQIISQCNEMNYKVYLHYRTCLHTYQFIHKFQNSEKMIKILSKIRHPRGEKEIIPNRKVIEWTPILEGVNTDALKMRNITAWDDGGNQDEEINNKFAGYVVDTFNKKSDTTQIKFEGNFELGGLSLDILSEQLGMKYVPNTWDIDQTITHKWDKKIGGKLILQSLIRSGGGWVAGLGGRGKSELIKEYKIRCDSNKKEYRWVRLVSKMMDCDRWEVQEDYLKNNPTTYECMAPTNKSANIIGGKTLHRSLGIMKEDVIVENEEGEEVIEKLSPQPYLKSIIEKFEGNRKKGIHPLCSIVVDEVSMVNGEMFSILAYIKYRIPNIKILLFGDIEHQLPPVGEENRNFNHSYVIKELTNFTKITLDYNFRMGVSGDKLWEYSATPQMFPCNGGELTDRNLCYTNKKRMEIIEERQDKILNPIIVEYEPEVEEEEEDDDIVRLPRYDERQTLKYTLGTPMIARMSIKKDNIAKNEMYYVVCLTPLKLISVTNNLIEIDNEILLQQFLSGFCVTIHKSQGETYTDRYTIHEWYKISQSDRNGMKRKLRYTAQSRSENPEKNIMYRI